MSFLLISSSSLANTQLQTINIDIQPQIFVHILNTMRNRHVNAVPEFIVHALAVGHKNSEPFCSGQSDTIRDAILQLKIPKRSVRRKGPTRHSLSYDLFRLVIIGQES